ncbi:unnamed protein product [Pleuronectes platessa]|uniref:Uncharacterized protein n=1 Tax=Pleuronectes platessa TaxID=8262 RepID=A0A9N7YGI7_PLEPL|nr:unnamed protein product [Pleuronectes platessa]
MISDRNRKTRALVWRGCKDSCDHVCGKGLIITLRKQQCGNLLVSSVPPSAEQRGVDQTVDLKNLYTFIPSV